MPDTPTTLPRSNSPTAEYREHYNVEEPRIDRKTFRLGWAHFTRLAALFEADRISREAFEAGRQWRAWNEAIGKMPTSRWERQVDRSISVPGPNRFQITASTKLKEAQAALGAYRIKVLTGHLIDDLPWRELGDRLRITHPTAKAKTIEALEALALWQDGRLIPRPRRSRRPQSG
jgi:hypothetical protein